MDEIKFCNRNSVGAKPQFNNKNRYHFSDQAGRD